MQSTPRRDTGQVRETLASIRTMLEVNNTSSGGHSSVSRFRQRPIFTFTTGTGTSGGSAVPISSSALSSHQQHYDPLAGGQFPSLSGGVGNHQRSSLRSSSAGGGADGTFQRSPSLRNSPARCQTPNANTSITTGQPPAAANYSSISTNHNASSAGLGIGINLRSLSGRPISSSGSLLGTPRVNHSSAGLGSVPTSYLLQCQRDLERMQREKHDAQRRCMELESTLFESQYQVEQLLQQVKDVHEPTGASSGSPTTANTNNESLNNTNTNANTSDKQSGNKTLTNGNGNGRDRLIHGGENSPNNNGPFDLEGLVAEDGTSLLHHPPTSQHDIDNVDRKFNAPMNNNNTNNYNYDDDDHNGNKSPSPTSPFTSASAGYACNADVMNEKEIRRHDQHSSGATVDEKTLVLATAKAIAAIHSLYGPNGSLIKLRSTSSSTSGGSSNNNNSVAQTPNANNNQLQQGEVNMKSSTNPFSHQLILFSENASVIPSDESSPSTVLRYLAERIGDIHTLVDGLKRAEKEHERLQESSSLKIIELLRQVETSEAEKMQEIQHVQTEANRLQSALQSKIDSFERELAVVRDERALALQSNDSLRLSLDEAEKELQILSSSRNHDVNRTSAIVNELERELQEKSEELEEAKETIADFETQLSDIQRRVASEMEALEDQSERDHRAREAAELQLTNVQKAFDELRVENEDLLREGDNALKQCAEVKQLLESLTIEKSDALRKLAQSDEKLTKANRDLQDVRTLLSSKSDELEKLQLAMIHPTPLVDDTGLAEYKKETDETIEHLRKQCDDLNEELARLEEDKEALTADLERAMATRQQPTGIAPAAFEITVSDAHREQSAAIVTSLEQLAETVANSAAAVREGAAGTDEKLSSVVEDALSKARADALASAEDLRAVAAQLSEWQRALEARQSDLLRHEEKLAQPAVNEPSLAGLNETIRRLEADAGDVERLREEREVLTRVRELKAACADLQPKLEALEEDKEAEVEAFAEYKKETDETIEHLRKQCDDLNEELARLEEDKEALTADLERAMATATKQQPTGIAPAAFEITVSDEHREQSAAIVTSLEQLAETVANSAAAVREGAAGTDEKLSSVVEDALSKARADALASAEDLRAVAAQLGEWQRALEARQSDLLRHEEKLGRKQSCSEMLHGSGERDTADSTLTAANASAFYRDFELISKRSDLLQQKTINSNHTPSTRSSSSEEGATERPEGVDMMQRTLAGLIHDYDQLDEAYSSVVGLLASIGIAYDPFRKSRTSDEPSTESADDFSNHQLQNHDTSVFDPEVLPKIADRDLLLVPRRSILEVVAECTSGAHDDNDGRRRSSSETTRSPSAFLVSVELRRFVDSRGSDNTDGHWPSDSYVIRAGKQQQGGQSSPTSATNADNGSINNTPPTKADALPLGERVLTVSEEVMHIDKDDLLDESFDAFLWSERTDGNLLVTVAMNLFDLLFGLGEEELRSRSRTFGSQTTTVGKSSHSNFVDRDTFYRYVVVLQSLYRDKDNAYHTSTHAADVAQFFITLLSRASLIDSLTPVEKLACLTAALAHDVEHPGVNNNFLVKRRDPVAVRYGGCAVLEEHHSAVALELLQHPLLNITANLDLSTELPHFFNFFAKLIHTTDMAVHFEKLQVYSEKVARAALSSSSSFLGKETFGLPSIKQRYTREDVAEGSSDEEEQTHGIVSATSSPSKVAHLGACTPQRDPPLPSTLSRNHSDTDSPTETLDPRSTFSFSERTNAEDRLMTLQMLLHMADIGNVARNAYVADRWSEAIRDENWSQGDEEKKSKGGTLLPHASPLFDREASVGGYNPTSTFFMDTFCLPLAKVLAFRFPSLGFLVDNIIENHEIKIESTGVDLEDENSREKLRRLRQPFDPRQCLRTAFKKTLAKTPRSILDKYIVVGDKTPQKNAMTMISKRTHKSSDDKNDDDDSREKREERQGQEHYEKQIEDLQNDLAMASKHLLESEQHFSEGLTSQKEMLEEEIRALQLALEEAQQQIDRLTAKVKQTEADHHQEINELEALIDDQAEKIEGLVANNAKLHTDLSRKTIGVEQQQQQETENTFDETNNNNNNNNNNKGSVNDDDDDENEKSADGQEGQGRSSASAERVTLLALNESQRDVEELIADKEALLGHVENLMRTIDTLKQEQQEQLQQALARVEKEKGQHGSRSPSVESAFSNSSSGAPEGFVAEAVHKKRIEQLKQMLMESNSKRTALEKANKDFEKRLQVTEKDGEDLLDF